MKRILALVLTVILLCSCADKTAKNVGNTNGSISESEPTVSEEAVPTDAEPAQTEINNPSEEAIEQTTKKPFYQFYNEDVLDLEAEYLKDELEFNHNYWQNFYDDLRSRPDSGKEVTIFADNTSKSYDTYHRIAYDFEALRYSVMAPAGWNGFRYYRDYYRLENTLTGIPIYDGEIPVLGKITGIDTDIIFLNAAGPMEKSTFFLAETLHGGLPLSIPDYITKFDHETYVDKKGRTLQVYFLDDLPKCAVYDDFYNLCIWFNLKSNEQIPIVLNMINSVEVSLSWDAEIALRKAERFGYTIIPPLNADY